MDTQIKIIKSSYGGYVQVSPDGLYAAQDGGRYYGYDPRRDAHAVRSPLRAIRDELDTYYASHDLPARWPAGESEIVVTVKGY